MQVSFDCLTFLIIFRAMSLSEHSNEMNSTLDMLHKIADKLGIPQQGQSEAQLALDIHLILKVELIVHYYDNYKEYKR